MVGFVTACEKVFLYKHEFASVLYEVGGGKWPVIV